MLTKTGFVICLRIFIVFFFGTIQEGIVLIDI
jgi:hypothetical protein